MQLYQVSFPAFMRSSALIMTSRLYETLGTSSPRSPHFSSFGLFSTFLLNFQLFQTYVSFQSIFVLLFLSAAYWFRVGMQAIYSKGYQQAATTYFHIALGFETLLCCKSFVGDRARMWTLFCSPCLQYLGLGFTCKMFCTFTISLIEQGQLDLSLETDSYFRQVRSVEAKNGSKLLCRSLVGWHFYIIALVVDESEIVLSRYGFIVVFSDFCASTIAAPIIWRLSYLTLRMT